MMLPDADERSGCRFGAPFISPRQRHLAMVVDILVYNVDVSQRAIGIGDPELCLASVAALDAVLPLSWHSRSLQPLLDRDELFSTSHAQARMVERPAGT